MSFATAQSNYRNGTMCNVQCKMYMYKAFMSSIIIINVNTYITISKSLTESDLIRVSHEDCVTRWWPQYFSESLFSWSRRTAARGRALQTYCKNCSAVNMQITGFRRTLAVSEYYEEWTCVEELSINIAKQIVDYELNSSIVRLLCQVNDRQTNTTGRVSEMGTDLWSGIRSDDQTELITLKCNESV
jgi:hypothetical protein